MRAVRRARVWLKVALGNLRPVWKQVAVLEANPSTTVTGAVQIERSVHMDEHVTLIGPAGASGGGLVVGEGVRLGRFVSVLCAASIRIGPGADLGDHATVIDSWAPVPASGRRGVPAPSPAPVVIGAGARLGPGAVVGPGVTIGDGAVVAPGAVVVGDVPAGGWAVGNPASVDHQ